MTIHQINGTVQFNKVRVASKLCWDGREYLRIQNVANYNAVNLSTGTPTYFRPEDVVSLLPVKFETLKGGAIFINAEEVYVKRESHTAEGNAVRLANGASHNFTQELLVTPVVKATFDI